MDGRENPLTVNKLNVEGEEEYEFLFDIIITQHQAGEWLSMSEL